RIQWGTTQKNTGIDALPREECLINHTEQSFSRTECLPSIADTSAPVADSARSPVLISSSLNQKYVFSSFVVASCNRLPHAAAEAVAENPGRSYNPFYLFGGVGLGKTHLVQAIGHLICQNSPALRVAYLSLEQFMKELVN